MKDTYGLVPPEIRANYARSEMVDRQVTAAKALYDALQAIDRRLDVVFISDRADPEWGVVPGRWHVVRTNEGNIPDFYSAIETADGKYREPDSGVITEMQSRDMWRRDLIPKHEPKKAPSDDGRIEELAHDIRAGSRVAGDGGLTKRKWGRG